jgi:hypothetical protein
MESTSSSPAGAAAAAAPASGTSTPPLIKTGRGTRIGGVAGAQASSADGAADGTSSPSSSSSPSLVPSALVPGRVLSTRELQYLTVKERSFGCLAVTNPLRSLCLRLTRSERFEYAIVLCVLINICILAAYDPLDRDNTSGRNRANAISEPIFTAIFTAEMLIKLIALDVWGKPNGYFNDGWNLLDAAIVALCYIQLAPGIGNIQSIRTIRLVRILRSFRSESIEIAMGTVAAVVPQLLNVGVVALFSLVTFGLFALMLFTGVVQGQCAYPYAGLNAAPSVYWSGAPCSIDCSGPFASATTCTITTGDACPALALPVYNNLNQVVSATIAGQCRRGPNPGLGFTNFDNVGSSMLTWYVISTLEGWSEVMYTLWHSFGAPVFISFFFMGFILIVPFFLYNLFTAAFIAQYSEVAAATRERRRRQAVERGLTPTPTPVATPMPPAPGDADSSVAVSNPLFAGDEAGDAAAAAAKRRAAAAAKRAEAAKWCKCWDAVPSVPAAISGPLTHFTNHWAFGSVMTLVIIANAILLACDAAGTSQSYKDNLDTANLIFVALFTAEMALKLLAHGIRGYASVHFNLFDGAIVIISIIEAIIVKTSPDLLQGGGTSALRAFRLLRVLKLAKSWKRLNKVLTSISAAVPAGAASLLVMAIMIIVFALMGMQLFGGQYDAAVASGALQVTPRANFNNLWWALVTTFWTFTGENWEHTLYAHMAMNGIEAFLFFVAMVAVGTYIFGNMYVAILLDAAGPAAQAAQAARDAAEAADANNAVEGGLPALALAAARSFFSFAGDECRDRLPNRGKAFGYCPCDCLEDEKAPADNADFASVAGAGKGAKAASSSSSSAAAPLQKQKPAPRAKPIGPVEFLPVPPVDTARADFVIKDAATAGAVLYVPATVDDPPERSVFADPEDPINAPPLAAAGMRVQILASGDARVIPQAPERLPCDIPVSRKKQFDAGELTSVAAENKNRELHGRAPRRWRLALGGLAQFIVKVFGRATYDCLFTCARKVGLITTWDDADVLAQIPDEVLVREAQLANVKLNVSVRKTYTPKNLRKPQSHESLGCILNDSPFRLWALRLTSSPAWERLTMAVIVLSTINLAIAEPWTDTCDADADANCGRMVRYLYGTDVFITTYFCIELLLKAIAQGLYFDDNAYLRDSWNALDAAIVVVSIISLSVESGPVRALRAFRALRALRPLRMVSRLPALKLVVNTLLQTIPKVCEVCIVSFLFLFIFAIIGTQNFKGAIAVCNDGLVSAKAGCTGTFALAGASCGYLPTASQVDACRSGVGGPYTFERRWESLPRNYDDIGQSLLTVWELGTAEDWPQRMVEAVDAVGEGEAMKRDANPAAALYFFVVQIIIAWTCFSFFSVIVFDTYNDLKSNAQGTRLLTATQRAWVDNVRTTLLQVPRPAILPPGGCRAAVFRLVHSSVFEWTIMLMILGNVIALACTHLDMDPSWVNGIEYANYAFTLVFAFEAALKVLGMGWGQYIRSPWHKFDFFLVIAAIISAAVSIDATARGEKLAGTPIATLLRILRVARLFRMVKASPGLQRVIRALIYALPALANVFGILTLMWFIWSIVGMQIFSGTRYGDWAAFAFREGQRRAWLNQDANFDSFPIAFMTVFRISTGDDFNGIMHDLMVDVSVGVGWGLLLCARVSPVVVVVPNPPRSGGPTKTPHPFFPPSHPSTATPPPINTPHLPRPVFAGPLLHRHRRQPQLRRQGPPPALLHRLPLPDLLHRHQALPRRRLRRLQRRHDRRGHPQGHLQAHARRRRGL